MADEDFRTSRRKTSRSEKRQLKTNARGRQRISTLRSMILHPDCLDARDRVLAMAAQQHAKHSGFDFAQLDDAIADGEGVSEVELEDSEEEEI